MSPWIAVPFAYGDATLNRMSHPLHGARPLDTRAGFPEAAAQISARWSEVADRGIIAAVEHNPELRDRVGELGRRQRGSEQEDKKWVNRS